MRKLILLFCLFSCKAFADCGNGVDSWSEKVELSKDLNQDSAIEAVIKVARHHCTDEAIQQLLPFTTIACAQIQPKNITSLSCYLESQVGYFFVTTDMLNHFFVQFNRWD